MEEKDWHGNDAGALKLVSAESSTAKVELLGTYSRVYCMRGRESGRSGQTNPGASLTLERS